MQHDTKATPVLWGFQSDLATLKSDFSQSVQDIKLEFLGLSYLIYCNNLASSYQTLRWVMPQPQKFCTFGVE